MRPILLHSLQHSVPPGWRVEAAKAAKKVADASPEMRAQEINNHAELWRKLKAVLRSFSHGKCWYCESIDDRSDNAVDHFRPKNHVRECPDKDNQGYWWLAFVETNYRFCCTFCNSARTTASSAGGKQDHFPLLDEAKRARTEADPIEAEEPLLLDPAEPADCALLTFDLDGSPACSEPDNQVACERVRQSIAIYHLDQPTIQTRRGALIAKLVFELSKADGFCKACNRAAYSEKMRELWEQLSETAQYSKAARAAVAAHLATSPSARVLLQRI